MKRMLIVLASALLLALSMQVTDASMARITCHCEDGDIQGQCLPSPRLPIMVGDVKTQRWANLSCQDQTTSVRCIQYSKPFTVAITVC